MNFIKTFYLIISFIILCLGITGSAHGDGASIHVLIGGTKIAIEVPPGFVEVKPKTSPALWKIGKSWTSQTKELLALLVEKEAGDSSVKRSPALKQYLLVQVPRQFKNVNLSDSDFTQVKKDFKQNEIPSGTAGKDEEEAIDEEDEAESESIKPPKDPLSEFTSSIQLEPNSFPLGVFHETGSSIGSVDILKQIIVKEGEKAVYLTAVATNILFLKGKLFYMYVLKEYHSQSDSEWVEIMSEHWVNTTNEMNRDKKKPGPKPSLTKGKKGPKKDLSQKQVGDKKIYFRNGRSLNYEKVWREGTTIFVIVKGKDIAVGYSESEIDMEKSFKAK